MNKTISHAELNQMFQYTDSNVARTLFHSDNTGCTGFYESPCSYSRIDKMHQVVFGLPGTRKHQEVTARQRNGEQPFCIADEKVRFVPRKKRSETTIYDTNALNWDTTNIYTENQKRVVEEDRKRSKARKKADERALHTYRLTRGFIRTKEDILERFKLCVPTYMYCSEIIPEWVFTTSLGRMFAMPAVALFFTLPLMTIYFLLSLLLALFVTPFRHIRKAFVPYGGEAPNISTILYIVLLGVMLFVPDVYNVVKDLPDPLAFMPDVFGLISNAITKNFNNGAYLLILPSSAIMLFTYLGHINKTLEVIYIIALIIETSRKGNDKLDLKLDTPVLYIGMTWCFVIAHLMVIGVAILSAIPIVNLAFAAWFHKRMFNYYKWINHVAETGSTKDKSRFEPMFFFEDPEEYRKKKLKFEMMFW